MGLGVADSVTPVTGETAGILPTIVDGFGVGAVKVGIEIVTVEEISVKTFLLLKSRTIEPLPILIAPVPVLFALNVTVPRVVVVENPPG